MKAAAPLRILLLAAGACALGLVAGSARSEGAAASSSTAPAATGSPPPAHQSTRDWLAHRDQRVALRVPDGAEVGGGSDLGLVLAHGDVFDPAELPESLRSGLAAWDGHGALVVSVVPGSPADAAALHPGDVVVGFAGLWVDARSTLVRMASRARTDREYELAYVREGEVWRTWVVPADVAEVEKLAAASGN